jgi:serine protease
VPQFVDVPEDSYFVRATSMLKQRGITTGTNPAEDGFSPQRQVNRQQMAALLWRMAGEPDAPESCGFVDEDQIASFARQATCWLLAQDITDNNPYRPLADVNRQQMAAFLWRFAGEPDAPDTCGIADQDSIAVWARQAVCWMTDTAITTNNPYEPLNMVNRAQMAAFLYRLGGQQNLWVSLAT